MNFFNTRKKRIAAGLSVLLAVLIGAVASVLFFWVEDPVYQGVSLGAMLDSSGTTNFFRSHEAVASLGPKAVRYLVHVLENEPSRFEKYYAKAYPSLPASLNKFLSPPKNYDARRARAAAYLKAAQADATPAVPLLIQLVEGDGFFGTRHNALGTLAVLAPATEHAERAIEVIVKRTSDKSHQIDSHAYSSLGYFTNHMEKVVPLLLHGLRSSETRESCMWGLKRMGTNIMPIVRVKVKNPAYLPMSFEELEREVAQGVR